MSSFEGSFLGKTSRIDPHSSLECGVCWWVYDPRKGDPVWQIAPGTAFSALPEHWRCPNCDAAQHQFMVLETAAGDTARDPQGSAEELQIQSTQAQLRDAYAEVDLRMRSLPVYRSDLPLGVLTPRRCDAGLLTVVHTPWCMNLLLIAPEAERLIEGTVRNLDFPSGAYPFTRGHLTGVGAIESCSLFSPMDDFADAAAVEAVAAEILDALFTHPDSAGARHGEKLVNTVPDRAEELPENPGRRRFLSGAVVNTRRAAGP